MVNLIRTFVSGTVKTKGIMAAGVLSAAIILFQADTFAQEMEPSPGLRLNQTPDCLVIENVHSEKGQVRSIGILDTRLHLYIYVPRATAQFTLGIYDQDDDTPAAQASEFVLFAPDGSRERGLSAPRDAAWSDYTIETNGQWGVWRLSISGPQDFDRNDERRREKARNYFMVRTLGEVDLYLKPEAVMRVRGVRLAPPRFGGAARHEFTVQLPGIDSSRFTFLWPRAMTRTPQLTLDGQAPATQWNTLEGRDDRLPAEMTLGCLKGTLPQQARWGHLSIPEVSAIYGLGSEQELRLFFNSSPLMPLPQQVPVRTQSSTGSGLAARLEISSPQTVNEIYREYTDGDGQGSLSVIPGISYSVQAAHGWGQKQTLPVSTQTQKLTFNLPQAFPKANGWYSGDNHLHTCFYDGTHTPAQCVAAARAAGLDWVTMTEHGHSRSIERVEKVNAEATALSEPGRFVVLPGMEYTGPSFHANVLGGVVHMPEKTSLPDLIAAALGSNTVERPVTIKLNHPTLGQTAAGLARELNVLPLIELWNSREPGGTELWWELLNKGMRTFAEASSDSHHRENLMPGHNRTFIYLGEQPLTPVNIINALREGRSFLSRGAFLDFTVNGARPGDTIRKSDQQLTFNFKVESTELFDSVEIVKDGQVVERIQTRGTHYTGQIERAGAAGWYLARVMQNGQATPLAMTNPIWVQE